MNNTLVKGLQLLELLARSDGPLGVSEIAGQLNMGKSNVHRLLHALVDLRYVHQDDIRGAYWASLKAWEVGHAVLARLDVRNVAAPAMERLLASTRETIHLSVVDGNEVVYIQKLDSPEPVRAYSQVGGRAPAHCVATGKAILAWQSERRIREAADGLTRYTERTIVDAATFVRELARVRHNGYAINRGEWREGVSGVAAPIRNVSGDVVAAIGISGPSTRLSTVQSRQKAPEVVAAANAISDALAMGLHGR
jgi:DNA-binding IclR family transcriptional regulator